MPIVAKISMENIWRITLLTNPDSCNLRCRLCFLHQREKPFGMGEMPWEIAEKAIRRYASHGLREVIPSTMGEPLLYSQFGKLERLVSELDLKLNLTTNGTFPSKGAERFAHELLPISSDIKVSCWGVGKSSWNVLSPGMDVEAYLKNLGMLVRVRRELSVSSERPLSSLSLQMTVTRTNRGEVPQVLELAASLGFDRVKLNRAVFLSNAKRYDEELPPDDFLPVSATQGLPIRVEGTFLHPPKQIALFEKCPFSGRELWILPDGSTEPCPDPEYRYGIHVADNRCERCLLFPRNVFSKA